MSSWIDNANKHRYYYRKGPEKAPSHRRSTPQQKRFGIACYWLLWNDKDPWCCWYPSEAKRDQAFVALIKRERSRSFWRLDRDDFRAIYHG